MAMRIGLISRCKNEPYVKEFVDYYLWQGVDKIILVDDNSDASIYKDVEGNDSVQIIKYNSGKTFEALRNKLRETYRTIKRNNLFDWLIHVDMDEFITTKRHYNNTIRDELETTFKDAHLIKVPWVMMSCNNIRHNPKSLLETNVYRWNHDIRHVNNITRQRKFRCRYDKIEVKSIFKPQYFDDISDHVPASPNVPLKTLVHVESIHNSIDGSTSPLSLMYPNLRESGIANGYLLCYHYRIPSIQHALEKIEKNSDYSNYTLAELLSTDYSEVLDLTLRTKSKMMKA